MPKYLTGKKCDFWRTEPDAVQGGECAAVRALQAGANAATRRFWKPKTHSFLGEYLGPDAPYGEKKQFSRHCKQETTIIYALGSHHETLAKYCTLGCGGQRCRR
jgi:hypothetical protein